jgi:hypothetical protein
VVPLATNARVRATLRETKSLNKLHSEDEEFGFFPKLRPSNSRAQVNCAFLHQAQLKHGKLK